MEKIVEESINIDGECENGGGFECLEHTVEFDQEIGEVCSVCGFVVMEIGNLWARDVRSSCSSAMFLCHLKC